MYETKSSKTLASLGLVIILLGVFYSGFMSGKSHVAEASKIQVLASTLNGEKTKPSEVDFVLFWKTWNIVNEKFVAKKGASSTSEEARVYGAIQGMVEAMGDPYTTFFPPEEATLFETEIEGNFEGVGMEMGIKNDILTVVAALKNSPAEKAGIMSEDKIVGIDGKTTNGMTIEQAIKVIRGKKGTSVVLSVLRAGSDKPLEITIVRDVINLPTLDTEYDQKNQIFTIKLYNFSAQSTTLFRSALRDFINSKSNKLILDLRGNPGGFLDAAVDMASWFLPPGKVIVREDYGQGKPETVEKSRGYNVFSENLKMVILIDAGSASASEILAGALSEYGRAKLVGTQTFGKGSVQEYIKVSPDTALKVTIARWLTPNGVSISEGGLKPDYEVKLTEENVKNKQDLQRDKAVELLVNGY